MAIYILAAIILLPLVEIAVFIAVGSAIGIFPTVLLTVLTAIAGTVMLRQQGLSLVMRMQSELDAGRVPGEDIMHGAMIVMASVLLLIPGFITDIIGLLLFVPPVRDILARFIVARANVVVVQGGTVKRDDRVVDLDEGDWTDAEEDQRSGSPSGSDSTPRISPWSSDDGQPKT